MKRLASEPCTAVATTPRRVKRAAQVIGILLECEPKILVRRFEGCGIWGAEAASVELLHYLAVPLSCEVCVPAKSVTEIVAGFVPAACEVNGLNCTLTTQVAPGANVVVATSCPFAAGPQLEKA